MTSNVTLCTTTTFFGSQKPLSHVLLQVRCCGTPFQNVCCDYLLITHFPNSRAGFPLRTDSPEDCCPSHHVQTQANSIAPSWNTRSARLLLATTRSLRTQPFQISRRQQAQTVVITKPSSLCRPRVTEPSVSGLRSGQRLPTYDESKLLHSLLHICSHAVAMVTCPLPTWLE